VKQETSPHLIVGNFGNVDFNTVAENSLVPFSYIRIGLRMCYFTERTSVEDDRATHQIDFLWSAISI